MAMVNDFAFKIATVNGTGSASANGLLMQSIYRMGIPVSGKNVFPSNIQGLPTWYEIRVNKDGHTARPAHVDLVVALNPATYAKDVDAFAGDRERTLMRNIAYTGALVALLNIDMDVLGEMIREQFAKKRSLIDSNFRALHLGYDYAKKHFACPLPIRLERMNATRDYVLLDGNTAAALGCLYAGATVGAWYPITPATSLVEAFSGLCKRYRVDPATKHNNYCILQAEDELAAAGITIGAGWAGARAFTSTAGPGISLMSEFIGLAYYTEIPGVFFDIQRTGPSTGMPTRTQQADLLSIAYLSHGDTKHIALFPADPGECFYMSVTAFDLAERFQTPVFVVSDLDIGMNDWMVKRLTWDDEYRPDRGKVLDAEALERIQRFSRYLDVDGDGIAARSLPGVHPKGAYFVRGSGHDKHAAYTEDAAEYREVVDRLAKKLKMAEEAVPAPEIFQRDGAPAPIGLVGVGGTHAAILEAKQILAAQGVDVDYMRIKAFPFGAAARHFLDSHERVFVVEQNRDAQLRSLLTIETGIPRDQMTPILDYGGLPLTAELVTSEVARHLEATVA